MPESIANLTRENNDLKSKFSTLTEDFSRIKDLFQQQSSSAAPSAKEKSHRLEFLSKEYDDFHLFNTIANKELQRLSSKLSEVKARVDAIANANANAIDEFQENSFQYNVKIVGVPEVCSDEAASTTSKLCVKLFKEMGENISIQGIDTAHRVSQRNKEVNNVVSEAETTLCGVSQGSVLGPLLFLLYINDIYKSSSLFAFYLFADDTSIILANNNLKELETLVNR